MKPNRKKLQKIIEEATVDCHDEYEQAAGFEDFLEDEISFPFRAMVLGEKVEVTGTARSGRFAVKVTRHDNGKKFLVDVFDLHEISGAKNRELIEAYRLWKEGG